MTTDATLQANAQLNPESSPEFLQWRAELRKRFPTNPMYAVELSYIIDNVRCMKHIREAYGCKSGRARDLSMQHRDQFIDWCEKIFFERDLYLKVGELATRPEPHGRAPMSTNQVNLPDVSEATTCPDQPLQASFPLDSEMPETSTTA